MSIYFLETSKGSFSLNSTSTISKSMTGSATANPVESGAIISDHYVNKPDIFSLTGRLTSVGGGIPPKEVIEALTTIKEAGEQFTFHFGSSITPNSTCVLTSIQLTQNKVTGNSGGSENHDAFVVSLKIQVIRTVDALKITHERSEFIADTTAEKKVSSESATEKNQTDGDRARAQAKELRVQSKAP